MIVATKNTHGRQIRSAPEATREFDFSPWTRLPPLPSATASPLKMSPPGVSVLERLIALVLIIILSPLLILIALAIKLDSRGGLILYRQERVGLDRRCRQPASNDSKGALDRRRSPGVGEVFLVYKFRTMIPDAEKSTGPVWASEHDPRITRLGHILRHLRLDELPQLFNVLCGQMRLIGPRPERLHFVKQLCVDIPEYPHRQTVPPGITGLAQVEREYDASVDDVRRKIRYDVFYVENRCALLDIKILIKTIDVALRGRGAR